MNSIAKALRKNLTDSERKLWRYLRARQLEGLKFRRQEPIGGYVVDFVCFEKHLVIEVDGGQHAQEKNKDAVRDAWLREQGFRVLRFWDNEVMANTEGVLDSIRENLSYQPSPLRGEEKGGGDPRSTLPQPLPSREGSEIGCSQGRGKERGTIERREKTECPQGSGKR